MRKIPPWMRHLAHSIVTGAALLALPAVSLAADPSPPPDSSVSAVVVTGSRIPMHNLTSVSPIQTVTAQQFQLQGHTDVVDLLNNLPQEYQNSVSDFSNTSNPLSGPGGIATADLRGLGPQRTLVLVNGRRLGIGDANTGNNNPAPDLDQIPAIMVERVEVVTGGASATYGSDAMAGVINFILKRNFEGVRFDAQLSGYQHHQHNAFMESLERAKGFTIPGDAFDGRTVDLAAMFGANSPDGKGNITAYYQYHHAPNVSQGTRDFSACKLNAGNAANSGSCSGSPNSNQWILDGGSGNSFSVVGTSLLPYPQATSTPPAIFNSSPYQYLSRNDVRTNAGFIAHYDVIKEVSFYSEFSFMNDRTRQAVAPSGLFQGGNVYSTGSGGNLINCDNALASPQELGVLCGADAGNPAVFSDVLVGRRNVEGGARQTQYEHNNYRGVLGMRGNVADAWHYDLYGSYYYTSLYSAEHNYLSIARSNNALDVVTDTRAGSPTLGQPVCQSVISGTDLNCVPYNIFKDGGVTPAAISYLTELGTEYGTVQEQIAEGDLTGDLGKYGIQSPWANTGIQVAVGATWRQDVLDFEPDAAIGSGDLSGGSGVGSTIHARISVVEGYGETTIPIVHGVTFFDDLQINGGVRYSVYSTGPTPVTYKVGGQWSPISDLRIRGSYQVAIRAPSIIELFNPATVTQSNSFGAADPCAGATPAMSAADCAKTGVTAGQYGNVPQCPATQCDVSAGGNVALKPEQAQTLSVGLTFRPSFFNGFNASVDYWDISQTALVNTIPPDTVLAQCVATGSPDFCGLIHRSSTGALFGPSSLVTGGYVVGTGVNIAAGDTRGIDIQADYRLDLSQVGVHNMGTVTMGFNGSYLLNQTTTLAGVPTYDCAGLFGTKCQTVNPRWRHVLTVSWTTPWNVLASLQWRMIGGSKLDTNSAQVSLTNNQTNVFSGTLPTVNYLDLGFIWTVRTGLKIRAGIDNLLDQDPPLISSLITGTGSPNAYPTYDLLGRKLFIGVTADF